jgi:Reverse transcriptase (RNA-dependent DNA polymerase)
VDPATEYISQEEL